MRRLDGKTVIVSGASMGIGAAISRRLNDEGASLVLVARREPPLRALVAELGDSAEIVVGSVDDPSSRFRKRTPRRRAATTRRSTKDGSA